MTWHSKKSTLVCFLNVSTSQTRKIRNIGGIEPVTSLYKFSNSELIRHNRTINDPITRPRHPRTRIRTGSTVQILPIVQRTQCKRPVPLQPSSGIHKITNVRFQINGPRILLPRTAQIRFKIRYHRNQIRPGRDFAIQDRNPGVLVRVLSSLGGEDVFLVFVRLAGVEVAVLEDDGGVAEDKVDGAVDVAFAVELAEGVDVEGVLVADEAALVECGKVGAAS